MSTIRDAVALPTVVHEPGMGTIEVFTLLHFVVRRFDAAKRRWDSRPGARE